MTKVKGSKRSYVDPITSIPDEGRFNPYDYLNLDTYKQNRRGQALYAQDLAQLQYLAELRQQQYMEDYQDPSADVSRQRDAGLNPDLLGLSGQSAPGGPTTNINPRAGEANNLDQTKSVFSIIGTTADIALSMMSGGVELSSMLKKNFQQDIDSLNSLYSLIDARPGAYSYTYPYRVADYGSSMGNLPFSRSTRKKLEKFHANYFSSDYGYGKRYEARAQTMKRVGDAFSILTNPLYAPLGYGNRLELTPEDWIEVWKPLSDYAYRTSMNELKSKNLISQQALEKNQYRSDVDYSLQEAKTEVSELDARSATADLTKNNAKMIDELREPMRKVVQNLQKNSKKGKSWAEFALIALSAVLPKIFR